jgi:hypothetical protein
MSTEDLIRRLWAEHMAAGFPSRARGLDVAGVDLVLLDSSAAGIIQSAAAGQALMPHQAIAIAPTLEALRTVVPLLGGDMKPYFSRLLVALQAVDEHW